MKLKNSFFSRGLYLEGLKQLRLFGILGCILSSGLSILMLLGHVFSAKSAEASGLNYSHLSSYSGIDAAPALIITFIILAPLMTLWLFHFLNKRNSSDFFHAIPHTRLCLFISFFTAIMSWIAITILMNGIVCVLINLLFSKYVDIAIYSLILAMLYCFSASMIVTSAILIAVSITGTVLSNILLTGMILFIPRLLVYLLYYSPLESIPIIYIKDSPLLLDNNINPITGLVFEALGICPNNYVPLIDRIDISSIIYGIILSIIYLCIGAFLFIRRKSETAGKSAPNRKLQAVYRIIITMTYCCCIITPLMIDNKIHRINNSIFEWFVLYLVAILIYLMYELITTKKIKSMIRSIPGLGIVAVLNIILIFSTGSLIQKTLNYTPSAEEINSFSIDSTSNRYRNNSISISDYLIISNNIEIKDSKAIEAVSKGLYDCSNKLKEGSNEYYNAVTGSNYRDYNIKINTNGDSKYRRISLNTEQANIVNQALQDEFFKTELWNQVPAPSTNINDLSIYANHLDMPVLTDGQKISLYETLKKEIKTLSIEEWNKGYMNYEYNSIFNIEYYTKIDGINYSLMIPVYDELTPETVQMFYDMAYVNQKDQIKELKNFISNKKDIENYSCTVEYYTYNEEENHYDSKTSYYNIENLIDVLDCIIDQPIKNKDEYVSLSFYSYEEEFGEYSGDTVSFAVDKEKIRKILKNDKELDDIDTEFYPE